MPEDFQFRPVTADDIAELARTADEITWLGHPRAGMEAVPQDPAADAPPAAATHHAPVEEWPEARTRRWWRR